MPPSAQPAQAEIPQPTAPEIPQPTAPEIPQPTAPGTPQPTAPGTPQPTAAEIPSAAPAKASPGTPAATGEAKGIPASTKRTAAGLPDPLPGYVSWLRLKADPAAPREGSPHYAARQPYILVPERDRYSVGEKLSPPLKEGTTVVLEEKKPEDDFVRRLSVMTREKEGWKFLEYSRSSSPEAFAPVQAEATACSSCHDKRSASDSVYSLLILE